MEPALWNAGAVGSAAQWGEGQPLWKIVPKRDEFGRPCSDFMMLAPGLNKRSPAEIQEVLLSIRGVLHDYRRWVVFADFNMKLNLLWVSLRQQHGVMSEIAYVLHTKVPALKLVGHHPDTGN